MNLVSLSQADSLLQEDGVEVSRMVVCNAALHVINHIGKPYRVVSNQSFTITVPSSGTVTRPEALISVYALNAENVSYATIPTSTEDGQPFFARVEVEGNSGLPLSLCSVQEGVIVFDGSLRGMSVTVSYTSMPIAEDGWPLVSEYIIEPVYLRIEDKLVRRKMVGSGLLSKPTNNMIIATKRNLSSDYHKSLAYARSQIARENEAEE